MRVGSVSDGSSERLAHLPLALFSTPLGIGGLGLSWREAAQGLGAPALIGEALLLLGALIWVLVAALHLGRTARHPGAMAADLRHPVRAAFAGAATISLMISAGALGPYAPEAAGSLWLVAVAGHVLVAIWTVRGLIEAPREPAALTPPMILPLVGNILAPIFGARLGFPELSWMMFGLGLLLWVMLQPLLLLRVATGPTLPPRLRPTLGIFLAPPAVGALALASLTDGFGPGPLAALGLAVFFAGVLLSIAPGLMRTPFAMSWWGVTFPSAAFATALQAAARAHPAPWQAPLLWLVLLGTTGIIGAVALRTLRAALNGELLQPEA